MAENAARSLTTLDTFVLQTRVGRSSRRLPEGLSLALALLIILVQSSIRAGCDPDRQFIAQNCHYWWCPHCLVDCDSASDCIL